VLSAISIKKKAYENNSIRIIIDTKPQTEYLDQQLKSKALTSKY